MNLINKENIPYLIAAIAGVLLLTFVVAFTESNNDKVESTNEQVWSQIEAQIPN